MGIRFGAGGDASQGEAHKIRQKAAPPSPSTVPRARSRWRRPRVYWLILAVVLLIAMPSYYVLTQDESRTTPYVLSVTTSCPRGVWSPQEPGEFTGACLYLGFLDLPSMSRLSGSYAASNSSPLWVVVGFLSANFNSTASNGSFALDGTAPYSWASAPWPFGWGDYPAAAAITVESNYPITVTFQGEYSSPALA